MKPFFSAKRQPSSPTISRRRLLQLGGIGLFNLGLPGMVAAHVDATGKGAADKSCIFVLLCGGPSHLDTWDLKPSAPAEIRGPYKPIATTVPGMRISELNMRLADQAKHFCLIRSMTHTGPISNHFDAMHNCLSGVAGAPADAPYIGSMLAKLRPSQRNVASYVWLIKCVGDPVFCAEHRHGRLPGQPLRPALRRHGREQSRHAGLQTAGRPVRLGRRAARALAGPKPVAGGPGSNRRRRTWRHGPMAGRAEGRL